MMIEIEETPVRNQVSSISKFVCLLVIMILPHVTEIFFICVWGL